MCVWCVCYECSMFYQCIIKDLKSVNKHLLLFIYYLGFLNLIEDSTPPPADPLFCTTLANIMYKYIFHFFHIFCCRQLLA